MTPQYPAVAKAGRIHGTVVLQADISTAGQVESLKVLSGPPLLQKSALEAVKTWRYRPYLLNGKAVEVSTQIDIIFTLAPRELSLPARAFTIYLCGIRLAGRVLSDNIGHNFLGRSHDAHSSFRPQIGCWELRRRSTRAGISVEATSTWPAASQHQQKWFR
jgi:TonB family protein